MKLTINRKHTEMGIVKLTLFSIFVAMFTLTNVSVADIEIGTGTTSLSAPLSAAYHDARTQTIYHASEIGSAMQLTSLALDVETIPGQVLNNYTIRLKHTDLAYYSFYPQWESAEWTTVFQADQMISDTGWNTFIFDAPFSYNGTQNLMVDISFNNSSSSSDGLCRVTSDSRRSLTYTTDSSYGDPLIWSYGTPGPRTGYFFPNIRLGYTETTVPHIIGMTLNEAQNAITAANLTLGNITLTFSDTVPEGIIYDQSPVGGQVVPYETPVNLVKSLGARYSGSGTASDPYQIATKSHLMGLSITPEDYGAFFILTGNINLDGQVFSTAIIAQDTDPHRDHFQGTAFTGTFDGNGYQITNFVIQGETNDCLGLFGTIDPGGSVLNLGIENFSITGTTAFTSLPESEYIGGIAGINTGLMSNCYSNGSINSLRSHCVGGLAGINSGAIEQCRWEGSISGPSIEYAGGILGKNYGTVNECWVTGSVNGQKYIGGLAGEHSQGDITNCYAEGTVSSSMSSPCLGGLVGLNSGSTDNCHSTSTIIVSSGASIVGGLAGSNPGHISNSYSSSSVEGFSYIGGLAGNNTGTLNYCYSTGTVSGSADSEYIGGLSGKNSGRIDQSYSTSLVYGYKYVGGLVGLNEADGNINECFSEGSVNGLPDSLCVGGLAGRNFNSTINNCYSKSSVHGNHNIGGLVGCDNGIVNNCYSRGIVSGDTNVGGLTGLAGGAVNCFWDTQTSGITESAGGTSRTTFQLQQAANYIAWNTPTKNVWTLDEGNDYPRLSWENQPGTPLPAANFSDFVPGQGTLANPYRISTPEQLNLIGYFYDQWNRVFYLENDINCATLSNSKFNKIGINDFVPFSGIFDGNGYSIHNFSYSGSSSEYSIGFFGYIDTEGQVQNLGLQDCTVSGFSSSYLGLGGMVARNNGSIYNCYVKGVVSGNRDVGGLAGNNWGDIKSCYAISDIYTTENYSSRIGGLVGYNPGRISNSFSEGTVNGGSESYLVGGLVGHLYGDIINCYSTSTTCGYENIGGLVGNFYAGDIINCYATGTVTGLTDSENIGGLVGSSGNITSDLVNSYSTGLVNGTLYVGGLIGRNYGASTVSSCYSTGLVNGSSYVGGLIGDNNGTVNSSFWDIQTSGQTSSAGGSPKTTAELKTLSTFTNAGWDFSMSWIDGDFQDWSLTAEGVEYPQLKWQFPSCYSGGTGIAKDPYRISTIDDFRAFVDSWKDWDKCFILNCNINLNGILWPRAVIYYGLDNTAFRGTFDGNGHKIMNLLIQSEEDCLGLFSQIEAGGQIKKLCLENCVIEGIPEAHSIGSLAGQNNGRINHCSSSSTVNGGGYVGGLIGINYGDIYNCYADSQISGGNGIGGLIGKNCGNIDACFATGSAVNASIFSQGIGGLVGYNSSGGVISNCYAMGSVDGSQNCSDFGGLVGHNSQSTIRNCYSSGLVNEGSPGMDFGGLVGGVYYDATTITINSFWDIQTSGQTTSRGGEGKTTAELMTLQTFMNAGWDFSNETANGSHDYWRLCSNGASYPTLNWQSGTGDFACPDGVNLEDFDFFAVHWMEADCYASNNNCAGVDLDGNGEVDLNDWAIFALNWLIQ